MKSKRMHENLPKAEASTDDANQNHMANSSNSLQKVNFIARIMGFASKNVPHMLSLGQVSLTWHETTRFYSDGIVEKYLRNDRSRFPEKSALQLYYDNPAARQKGYFFSSLPKNILSGSPMSITESEEKLQRFLESLPEDLKELLNTLINMPDDLVKRDECLERVISSIRPDTGPFSYQDQPRHNDLRKLLKLLRDAKLITSGILAKTFIPRDVLMFLNNPSLPSALSLFQELQKRALLTEGRVVLLLDFPSVRANISAWIQNYHADQDTLTIIFNELEENASYKKLETVMNLVDKFSVAPADIRFTSSALRRLFSFSGDDLEKLIWACSPPKGFGESQPTFNHVLFLLLISSKNTSDLLNEMKGWGDHVDSINPPAFEVKNVKAFPVGSMEAEFLRIFWTPYDDEQLSETMNFLSKKESEYFSVMTRTIQSSDSTLFTNSRYSPYSCLNRIFNKFSDDLSRCNNLDDIKQCQSFKLLESIGVFPDLYRQALIAAGGSDHQDMISNYNFVIMSNTPTSKPNPGEIFSCTLHESFGNRGAKSALEILSTLAARYGAVHKDDKTKIYRPNKLASVQNAIEAIKTYGMHSQRAQCALLSMSTIIDERISDGNKPQDFLIVQTDGTTKPLTSSIFPGTGNLPYQMQAFMTGVINLIKKFLIPAKPTLAKESLTDTKDSAREFKGVIEKVKESHEDNKIYGNSPGTSS